MNLDTVFDQQSPATSFTFVPTEAKTDLLEYVSKVTSQTAALKKAPEFFAAKELVLSGQKLPKPRVRYAEASEIDAALVEVDAVIHPHLEAMRRAGARQRTTMDKIMAIIKKGSIQTSLTRFEDPEAMRVFTTRLRETIECGAPVVLAMPQGGGKTHMPLKTGNFGLLPDFSEFLSLKMRAALVTAVREVYAGGAHMIDVSDAPLHTRDLGVCPAASKRHITQLWSDLARLGIKDEVIVADTPNFLPPNWLEAIDEGTREVRHNIEQDPGVRAGAEEQVQSLLFAKNCTEIWPSQEETLLGFAVIAGAPDGVPEATAALARAFEQETREVVAMYMAINHHGIRGMRLIERVVERLGFSPERYLRLSVHAKPGNPRPALSISNHMAPPALLPKHSVGLRILGGKPRWGLTFDLVAKMRGWDAVYEAETGRFMYYEGAA
jgi:hypothetical protein